MTQEDVHFVDKSAESEVGEPGWFCGFCADAERARLLVMDVDSNAH